MNAQPVWTLQDAKARFSEVVRRARSEGPQRVTVRGEDAVVVVAVEAFGEMPPPPREKQNLLDFLQSLAPLAEVDLTRPHDGGREPPV